MYTKKKDQGLLLCIRLYIGIKSRWMQQQNYSLNMCIWRAGRDTSNDSQTTVLFCTIASSCCSMLLLCNQQPPRCFCSLQRFPPPRNFLRINSSKTPCKYSSINSTCKESFTHSLQKTSFDQIFYLTGLFFFEYILLYYYTYFTINNEQCEKQTKIYGKQHIQNFVSLPAEATNSCKRTPSQT